MIEAKTEVEESGIYSEALLYLQRVKVQSEAMRRALEQAMDSPGGMEWEEEIGGPILPRELEPTPESVPRMEDPPPGSMAEQRLVKMREQVDRNWPTKKFPFIRKPWRSK